MLQESLITLDDLAAIVTAIVAIAAFGLAVYNLLLARKDKQIQLKAKLTNGFLPRGPDIGALMLILEVVNPGEKPATITSVGLRWKKQTIVFFQGVPGTTSIPFELHPGKNANFWTPVREIAHSLKDEGAKGKTKLRAQFSTAVGTEHLSKPYRFDVDEWTRPRRAVKATDD